MKKRTFQGLFALFLCLFLALPVRAEESSLEDAIRDVTDLPSLEEQIPEEEDKEEIQELAERFEVREIFSFFLEKVRGLFTLHAQENLKFFASLLFFILVAGVWSRLREAFSEARYTKVFDAIIQISLAVFCYQKITALTSVCESAMRGMNSFLIATLPIFTAFGALGGKIQTAVIQNANLLFVIDIIDTIVTQLLLPLIRILFSFGLIGMMSDLNTGSISAFLQKTIKTVCVFLFTLLSGILTLQHTLAQAADSLTMRGVRFAAGSFIPVIGNLVGEATKTLAAGIDLIRTQCGILCVVLLLLIVLPPLLQIIGKKIILSLAKLMSEILQENKITQFLKETAAILDLLLALTLSGGIYFLYAIVLMIRSFAVI